MSKLKKKAVLVKKYYNFPDKVIYRGTLRGCKNRIKPSQKDRYEIVFAS